MVLFILVGIGQGKRAQRLVETVALAEVAADGRGIPGLGVRARQDPAADRGIAFELNRIGASDRGETSCRAAACQQRDVLPARDEAGWAQPD